MTTPEPPGPNEPEYQLPPPPPPAPPVDGIPTQPAYAQQTYAVPTQNMPLVLPGGVTLASPGIRIGAYFISAVLFFFTLGIGWAIWGLIVWGQGTSPALQVLGLKAYVPRQGRAARWGDMALRDGVDGLVTIVSCGVAPLVSFIMFLVDDQHRTLGDRIGSTVIVHDPNHVLG
jgi:uncharacterized RDD family membrane protein YckC